MKILILDHVDYTCNSVTLSLSIHPKYWFMPVFRSSDAFGMPHTEIPSQNFCTWRCNILVFSPLRTYIFH